MIQNKDILVIIAAAIIIGFFWFYNSHKEKKQKKEMEKLKMDYLLRMMTAIDNFVKKYDEYKDKISAENLQPMKLNGFQKEYEYEEVYIQISGDKIYRTAAEPATKDSYSLIFLENLIITNYKLLLKSTNDRHELIVFPFNEIDTIIISLERVELRSEKRALAVKLLVEELVKFERLTEKFAPKIVRLNKVEMLHDPMSTFPFTIIV